MYKIYETRDVARKRRRYNSTWPQLAFKNKESQSVFLQATDAKSTNTRSTDIYYQ